MGDIADQIVNGEICQICCCGEGEVLGFPYTCAECEEPEPEPKPKTVNKVKCTQCNKMLKPLGVAQHMKAKHSAFKTDEEIFAAMDKAEKEINAVLFKHGLTLGMLYDDGVALMLRSEQQHESGDFSIREREFS